MDQDIAEGENLNRDARPGVWSFLLAVTSHVLLVSPIGMATDGPRVGDGDAGKGQRIYQKHCLPCHGPQGKGDGQFGQVTKPPAADFTSAQSRKKSDAQLLDTIRNGRPPTAMEGWKQHLSHSEILDVLAYVKTFRQ